MSKLIQVRINEDLYSALEETVKDLQIAKKFKEITTSDAIREAIEDYVTIGSSVFGATDIKKADYETVQLELRKLSEKYEKINPTVASMFSDLYVQIINDLLKREER